MRADEGYELDRPTSAYGTFETWRGARAGAAFNPEADMGRLVRTGPSSRPS